MKNLGGIVMSLVAVIMVLFGGVYYSQMSVLAESAVTCKNGDTAMISFLINDEAPSVIMAGRALDPKIITVFNKTALAAEWSRRSETTKIFLDRIAGHLVVKTTTDRVLWDENDFDCQRTNIRF